MNESFSRIERGVMLEYLRNELPELQICKNNEPFLLLPQKTYATAQESIVFRLPADVKPETLCAADISVHFYYFNRGIFFISSLLVSKNAASISISKDLFKMPERHELQVSEFSGTVQFAVSNGKVTIACVAAKEFPLFCAETRTAAYGKNPATFTRLLEKYQEIDSVVRYPVCAFLSGGSIKKFAVLGRAEPLTVLYISEKLLVLGGGGNNFPFKKGFTCLFTGRLGVRTIATSCSTEFIYSEDGKFCAVCEFTGIKPEDVRFLYEKLYKTVFN